MATSDTLKASAKKKASATDPRLASGLADGYTIQFGPDGKQHFYYQGRLVPDSSHFTAGGAPVGMASAGGSPGGMPAPTAAAPPPPSAAVPGDNDGDGRVDPFFRPDDLAGMASFWSQWNTTFAQLDAQLADLRTQTTYDQAQQDSAHTQNQSNIQDDAAARGISHSSIKDGTIAQETTDYTRAHQLSQDKLTNQEKFVKDSKNTFETTTKPQTLAAWAAQQAANAGNAQAAWDEAHPAADAAAPVAGGSPVGQPLPPNADPLVMSRSGVDSKGNMGVWKTYKSGRQVFVAGGRGTI